MLLVCDSGSTKADWLVADNGKVIDSFNTMGFNPFFHNANTVMEQLSKCVEALRYKSSVAKVFFFGAGCSSKSRNEIIASGLRSFFSGATVVVDHDMLGAALASCNSNAGLVCILGTGSNIAYYDGKELSETRHGLGYIMGDENSGSYYGRKLISYFLYRVMPEDLRKEFFNKYGMTKEVMHDHVYGQPNVNVYLASFAKFLSDYKTHPWIEKLVYKGMNEFFETHIAAYPEYKTAPVHFIGSIAFHFSETLQTVAKESGFTVGKILVRPVDDLMKYFLESDTK